MPVNWKDPKAFERLLAAMVAAQEMKLDYRKIASMYGEGATYDAIEGRFRIIKKEAAKLLAEIESGERPVAPPRGTASSSAKSSSFATTSGDDNDSISTPKKPRKPRSTNTTPRAKKSSATGGGDKVLGGRVSKSPKKKDVTGVVVNGIKEEVPSTEESMHEFLGMGMDVESVVEGLGLDANSGYEGGFDMEI
ncbi:MAG: hypothetical protein L6R42_007207 [Xanthoria sp. 1 TBL-2021]|nr:MAG: hypothetical protein L6R42_007207 [Xanthoria sp. 1 TBL-2021]